MKKMIIVFTIMIIGLSFGLGLNENSFAVGNDKRAVTPSGIYIDQLEKEIDLFSKKYIGKSVPGAAVVITKNGEIIFSKGYGYKDIEGKQKVESDKTIFEWGSITKLFTWTAAMQLVEQGKLDIDKDIKAYLPPEFVDDLEYSQKITMKDLMNHTAGFGDYGFDLIYKSPDEVVSLEEGLLMSNPSQYYEVGSASAYSNHGTALAGYIIESITGMTYEAYLEENISKPLGMYSATASPTFDVSSDIKANKAKGYRNIGEEKFEELFWSYINLGPAGALNGTAEDLARFAIGLTVEEGSNTPIFRDNETLTSLFTPTYPQTANGFFIYNGEKESFGHGGNTAGFTSQFAVVPEDRFGIVVLTNVQGEMGYAYGLQELLIGKKSFEYDIKDEILPSTSNVEGNYISLRRPEGSFLDILTFMAPQKIVATSDNTIKLSFSGFESEYIQTAPYRYEITNNNSPLFNVAFPVLEFRMVDNQVDHIVIGHGFDMIPYPKGRGMFVQIISMIIIAVAAIVFIGEIIATAIKFIRRKKTNVALNMTYYKYKVLTIVLGLAFISNNMVCLGKFIVDSFRSFESLKLHIIINYIYVLVVVALVFRMVKKIEFGSLKRNQIVAIVLEWGLLIGTIITCYHWNFFVMY